MKEQLISFETAKLGKEKGFETNSNGSYDLTNGVKLDVNHVIGHIHCKDTCSIETQSLLQKWLREKHRFHLWIETIFHDGDYFILNSEFKVFDFFENNEDCDKWDDSIKKDYGTYEEALEKGLFEALKLIKS